MKLGKRVVGLAFVSSCLFSAQSSVAYADTTTLAKSNQVHVTGGYMGQTTVQQWEQTGMQWEYVSYQTGGGYYEQITYQSGTTQSCSSHVVATNHATYYPGHWVNTSPVKQPSGLYGWWYPGWYGAPYWNTYQTVTNCTSVPVYSTRNVWIAPTYSSVLKQVPSYGWIPVTVQQWVPIQISNS